MMIFIDLPEALEQKLLEKYGYVQDNVKAYYVARNNPYNNEYDVENLKPIDTKIAYHKAKKPKELEKEYPLLENLRECFYDNVINRLFNNLLIKKLF